MKRAGVVFLLLVLALAAADCGGGDGADHTPTPSTTPTPTPAAEVWGYLGDVNVDGSVDSTDLDIVARAIGTDKYDADWDSSADLDLNGKVDIADLAIAGRGYGSTHVFHLASPVSNIDRSDARRVGMAIDDSDHIHIAWEEGGTQIYYTRLDRFGNTLVDDLLLDSGSGLGSDGVGIACDADGNAHIVWDCHGSADLRQARIDRWGHIVLGGEDEDSYVDEDSTSGWPGVALDSSGYAHIQYRQYWGKKHIYQMVTDEGITAIKLEGDKAVFDTWFEVALDSQENVHWLYERDEEEGPHSLVYGVYGYGDMPSLPGRVITCMEHTYGVAGYERYAMSVDGDGNAFIVWPDKRDGRWGLYLEKVAPDGTSLIDDRLLRDGFHSFGLSHADIAVDSAGNIHVIFPVSFKGTVTHLAYGVFDNNAGNVSPVSWAVYGSEASFPCLAVDSHGDAHIVYTGSICDYRLCHQCTCFDAAAFDRSRPDLGVDGGHLNWEPFIARWGEDLEVTGTVFNTGWTASPATVARIGIMLDPDTPLAAPAQVDVDIPPLSPGETHEFSVTLQLPQTPPGGFESLEYVNLLVEVDPDDSIAETTGENNSIAPSLMVQPLPTTTGLFLIVRDDTDTARGREGVPLNTGTAAISGGSIDRLVPVTQYVTVLADDLPVSPASEPQTYTVSWSSSGFTTPPPANITISRNAGDPYIIDYDPENTALLVTDRWGSLSGTVSGSDGEVTAPLSGAIVRIEGQGIRIEATTDADGNFSPDSEAKLGHLIPGEYEIRVSRAGYARATGQVTIQALQAHTWSQTLETTTMAYVRGNVINQYGSPVSNAHVTVCDTTALTDASGIFDLGEVEADCTSLQVTCTGYAECSTGLSLTAGLETLVDDIELVFDPPVSALGASAAVASWTQDESSGDLLPDPPEDATWVEEQLFDLFSDKFWPSYRILVLWGCYEYDISALYSGPVSDRHLYQVQVRLVPKTFESHMVSGSGEMEVHGQSVEFDIGVFQDSGILSALRVIEARLVNADSGTVIKTVRSTVEGGTWWDALQEEVRTYDFGGVKVDDWNNAEVWIYLKVGKNEDGEWTGSPILRGWHFDQQVLRLDLSNPGESHGDYVIVDFPIP